jgi:DNA-binding transcriptional LysR family regulator
VTDAWRETMFPSMPARIRSQNVLLRIAAVRAGVGLSMLPCVLCDGDPTIVRVAGFAPVMGDPIWALTHPDLRGAARIRALMGFLAESFERHRGALVGELPDSALRDRSNTGPALAPRFARA